jgi:hypothetical protein
VKTLRKNGSEISRLGSGAEPADRIVWGKADTVFVKEKARAAPNRGQPPQPYSIGIKSIAKKTSLIPEAGCGQSPQKAILEMPYFWCKKIRIGCINTSAMVIL